MQRREGEEVTISYGQFPDDVFYLFYGFLPRDNPFNSVLLFRDLSEVARHLEVDNDIPSQIQLPFLSAQWRGRTCRKCKVEHQTGVEQVNNCEMWVPLCIPASSEMLHKKLICSDMHLTCAG